jgi:hypothetical protein
MLIAGCYAGSALTALFIPRLRRADPRINFSFIANIKAFA